MHRRYLPVWTALVIPFLDWDGPMPFAHRGGASDAPENTMLAFQYAVDLGYRYLETDVHVTADGVLVAFHDDDLQRTCGMPGMISELPWSDVSHGPGRRQGADPLLDDLLGTFPDARVNIDCKTERRGRRADRHAARTNALDRSVRRRVQRLPPSAPAQPSATGCARSLGPVGSGVAVRAASPPPGLRRAGAGHGGADHRRQPGLRRTSATASACKVHVWTIDEPPRCAACSTSASTAS